MERMQRTEFRVSGIQIVTTNKEAMEEESIMKVWNDFFIKDIFQKLTHKIDDRIYAVYSDFEEGFALDTMNKKYTLTIGCKVDSVEELPKWLQTVQIPEQIYAKYIAKGSMPGAVLKEWRNIWKNEKNKNNTVDFEVYSQKSQKGKDSEADIYIGVN